MNDARYFEKFATGIFSEPPTTSTDGSIEIQPAYKICAISEADFFLQMFIFKNNLENRSF